jgi:Family of unknown function (DUF5683)
MKQVFFVIAIILMVPMLALAQQRKDSLIVKDSSGTIVAGSSVKHGFLIDRDSTGKRIWIPRKATIYSAILPGLGQVYNKKYWKVPIVYTAIGIPVAMFFNNKIWYKRVNYALAVVSSYPNLNSDSLAAVHSSLLPFVQGNQQPSLLNYRNEFRKNMDYSILFTLLFWGLNVVDATVDAHLKGFNVNDNLTMQIKPAILSNQAIGVSIVVRVK